MVTLTIINSLVLIYLLVKGNKSYYTTLKKDYSDKVFLGYTFTIWRRTSYNSASSVFIQQISFKNRRKVKLAQEVDRIKKDKVNQRYTLGAIFSWLKTHEQVAEYVRDYREINPEFVDELVANFKPKKQ